jgi:calcium binding protein 39
MNFFKTNRPKSPADLVKSLRDGVARLDVGASGSENRRKVSAA